MMYEPYKYFDPFIEWRDQRARLSDDEESEDEE